MPASMVLALVILCVYVLARPKRHHSLRYRLYLRSP